MVPTHRRRAHMASYPPREAQLRSALLSLVGQVDAVHLVLNAYGEPPDWLVDLPTVHVTIPETDLKDEGKFIPTPAPDDVVFLCDDDIVYPADYVATMEAALRRYEPLHAVVGVHAVTYSDFFDGRAANRHVVTMAEPLERPRTVSQLGTGTVACFGRQLPDAATLAGSAGFVDVRFAAHCHANGYPRIAVGRPERWLEPLPCESSLYETVTTKWSPDVVREVLAFAGYRHLMPLTHLTGEFSLIL